MTNMNKIEIRKKRVQLKAERIAILRKIDELQSALDSQKDRKKRREIRLEIQKLGKLLESKVLYNISDHEFADSSNDYRDYATGKKKAWSMPIEKYIMYKKRGWLDKDIRKAEGISKHQLWNWKRKNGITREMWLQEDN